MATLKTTVAVVSTAVVVMIPGTKAVDPQTNEKPEVPTEVLQQELQGWVYQQATEGWITNDYPRSMGELTGSGDPLFEVSTAIGKENLDRLIVANVVSGVVGFGYSQGATVASLWLNDHANGNDPNAPSADDVSFVLIGSPNRPNGGLLARATGVYIPVLGVPFSGATPESQYAVTDVVRQYDIFADFPADPLNVFSLLNVFAIAGAIHGDYLDVDINDPANVVEVHGNTTYIMQPAKTLPLADALRNIAALFGRTETPVIDAFEPALKYLVELGYDRTSQATTVPFQPGSSIVRFLN
ncbi:PE-PPE domain-containing protein, partial [Candidatus Saccharibacteria bacterium]|nr:PE-PPE domain-containing protein [Candidatus Saccharibacteria bacterium]